MKAEKMRRSSNIEDRRGKLGRSRTKLEGRSYWYDPSKDIEVGGLSGTQTMRDIDNRSADQIAEIIRTVTGNDRQVGGTPGDAVRATNKRR